MKNLWILLFFIPVLSQAEEKKQKAEQVDLDQIKDRYWAQGDKSEMGVVQNRTYSKSGRFQLGVLGGVGFSDPFLDVKMAGVQVGYYFNEFWGIHLLAWKYLVGPSSALYYLENNLGTTTNTNIPSWYAGGEVSGSLIYGKLSLAGSAIIYYDLQLLAGLGATGTESGTYLTPHVGIGQRFYLSQNLSLRVDYRLMAYREGILEKVITPRLGEYTGSRNNFSNTITIGIDFLFGGSSEK